MKSEDGEDSTQLGEVDFLQQINKQIHQMVQYNGIGKLVLSWFLKYGWEVDWWYKVLELLAP